MEKLVVHLASSDDTEKFGRALGNHAGPGDVICLDGDLGAGKTTLTQAIARGLEVGEDSYVTSPSFAIFHEYTGRIPLYHMDFYRLEDEGEVVDLGFDEYFYLSGLTVIEWSNRAEPLLPENSLKIQLEITSGDARRALCLLPDDNWKKKLDAIVELSGLECSGT